MVGDYRLTFMFFSSLIYGKSPLVGVEVGFFVGAGACVGSTGSGVLEGFLVGVLVGGT
jgi:hypothetical protein